MYRLPDTDRPINFSNKIATTQEGLLAIGGNLNPHTLLSAYAQGTFPWFSENNPILWWNPNPRLVIFPESVHFSRRMLQICKKISTPSQQGKEEAPYKVTLNKVFHKVILECANTCHFGRESTWITEDMIKAYTELHKMGYSHSIEVWNSKKQLVGGMYGLAMGKIFFGESMFSHESNTSKIALFWLCDLLQLNKFLLLDCQVESKHLKSLGAKNISRKRFLDYLKKGKTHLKKPVEFLVPRA